MKWAFYGVISTPALLFIAEYIAMNNKPFMIELATDELLMSAFSRSTETNSDPLLSDKLIYVALLHLPVHLLEQFSTESLFSQLYTCRAGIVNDDRCWSLCRLVIKCLKKNSLTVECGVRVLRALSLISPIFTTTSKLKDLLHEGTTVTDGINGDIQALHDCINQLANSVPPLKAQCTSAIRHYIHRLLSENRYGYPAVNHREFSLHHSIQTLCAILPSILVSAIQLDAVFNGSWSVDYFTQNHDYFCAGMVSSIDDSRVDTTCCTMMAGVGLP